MDFHVQNQLMERLFDAYFEEQLPGFTNPGLEQLARADKDCWKRLAAATQTGVQPLADGSRPLDAALPKVLADPSFNYLLAPLPGSRPKPASPGPAAKKQKVADVSAPTSVRASSKSKRSGKGKGSGQQQGSGGMPPELAGMSRTLPDGSRPCFLFNMARGCADAPAGGGCGRGKHLCCRPGCYGTHSLTQCPQR